MEDIRPDEDSINYTHQKNVIKMFLERLGCLCALAFDAEVCLERHRSEMETFEPGHIEGYLARRTTTTIRTKEGGIAAAE